MWINRKIRPSRKERVKIMVFKAKRWWQKATYWVEEKVGDLIFRNADFSVATA